MFTKYLKSSIEAEYSPSLDSISQITSSEINKNIDILIENDILEAFNVVMTKYQLTDCIKVCLYCLSNITAGSENHIYKFL